MSAINICTNFFLLLMMSQISLAKVRLIDHGYEGVTIAINPDITENYAILHRLEKFLTATSATLFKATKNQLYFREFIVVIPEHWKPRQHYENALDVKLDRAQIVVDRSNPGYGDAPYVKQYAQCGSPGLYIHLTPGYLLEDAVVQKWGRPEKTLVHEWAHLRWGLFDEYPIDAQDDAFYRYAGLWQPTRCSTEVEGSILNEYSSGPCQFDFFTGKPERDCRFFPRMAANKAAASLMFMQYLDSIVEFCDDPSTAPKHLRHNYLAPNRQNRLCQYKSAWEVMRKHEDFDNDRKPLPSNTNTRPRFRYVQAHPRKRVLVLDTSGSMTGASLSVMKQAASNYILSCIETGSKLGIVQFSTNATALSQLREVKSETDRFTLIDSLPTLADGKTSIGSGLKKGVEVLTQFGDAPGGSIILITDGKENEGPYLRDLRPALMKRGIVVHALAYGQKAEQSIAELSQETGGQTFFYSGRPNSTALIDGLAATVTTENRAIPLSNVPYSLLTHAGLIRKDAPLVGSFFIDSTIGKETSLTFSFSEIIEVKIQGPDAEYTADNLRENFRYDLPSKVLKVLIPGDAKTGTWYYHVTTNASQSQIAVNIQSKSRVKGQDVLQAYSWMNQQGELEFNPRQRFAIYTEVSRGMAPVLNAEVMALIERPQLSPVDVRLQDNGVGADIIKGDGVYSASIMARDLSGDGRYNIKVKVLGKEGHAKVIVGKTGKSSRALEVETSGQLLQTDTESLESFQRVTSAGEFRLRGFPAQTAVQEMTDEIPPSRITDLRVISYDFLNRTANLQWTAVGGDMERGAASRYVVHVTEDFDLLLQDRKSASSLTHEKVIKGRLDRPLAAGATEELVIHADMAALGEKRTVFISVFAVDGAGNEGETSNVVSLSPAQETSVPRRGRLDGVSIKTYLVVVLPLSVATLVFLLVGAALLVSRARKSKSEIIEQVSVYNLPPTHGPLDLSHMNYMYEGEYRKRLPEDADTWSRSSL